jgi:putative endonuclease
VDVGLDHLGRSLLHWRMAFVYILECADGSYYVGSTRNVKSRLWQHQQGLGAEYTTRRLPVRLAYAHEFVRVADAFSMEKRVQGWSRAKREALIRGDFAALPNLSRRRGRRDRWRGPGWGGMTSVMGES